MATTARCWPPAANTPACSASRPPTSPTTRVLSMGRTRRALTLAVVTAFRADPWRSTAVLVASAFASLIVVLMAVWLRDLVNAAAAHDQDAALEAAVAIGLTA